ncbi:MAG: DUF1883 domain-containing protein [Flavobacteriales bacterium]|jgi:hypothetical protein|nr:DUF1883 domain-containing protein [Flavobacteriales bacterium]MBK9514401.1 DUF1883 domain-containing protein [Flavobacteriales bacterium]MBP7450597.1 DUF1883 domain-containing protein [Flavobacteriales bacterium]HOZ41119.1 DUF1883 domain-containing protein [Flavobacteriales bacterium]
MKFLHKTYEGKKKEIIEVEIDKPTKVKFMTAKEYKAYTNGKTHSYFGGTYEESPVRFVIPYDGNWNVVVEKGTLRQPLAVSASCRLTMPNSQVRTSLAADAPAHVRELELSAGQEENG